MTDGVVYRSGMSVERDSAAGRPQFIYCSIQLLAPRPTYKNNIITDNYCFKSLKEISLRFEREEVSLLKDSFVICGVRVWVN
jgi:hypothetical protein